MGHGDYTVSVKHVIGMLAWSQILYVQGHYRLLAIYMCKQLFSLLSWWFALV